MEAASQSGDLLLPHTGSASDPYEPLYHLADAKSCGLTREEFAQALETIGQKYNYGHPPTHTPDQAQKAAYLRTLHLSDLALAQSCALGHDTAWQRFLALYQTPLTHAAIAITGSATLGHDLAGSLYAELYGLRQTPPETRRSPLLSYSGRGSFLGWLRTTLAQRHIDHHRRHHRESPLPELEPTAPPPAELPANLIPLTAAIAQTLQSLPPEDRFLLATYFLDRQTLAHIARLLRVHEATVIRRLKRLVADLRKLLQQNLQSGGLSRRAAEEALGTDPRDLEINLRALLQTSQTQPFPNQPNSK